MAILQMLSIVVNIESIHKGRTARVNSPTTDAVAIVLSMVFLFALLSILL